jgi:hypothetical protein
VSIGNYGFLRRILVRTPYLSSSHALRKYGIPYARIPILLHSLWHFGVSERWSFNSVATALRAQFARNWKKKNSGIPRGYRGKLAGNFDLGKSVRRNQLALPEALAACLNYSNSVHLSVLPMSCRHLQFARYCA